jgi:hypothetical protein
MFYSFYLPQLNCRNHTKAFIYSQKQHAMFKKQLICPSLSHFLHHQFHSSKQDENRTRECENIKTNIMGRRQERPVSSQKDKQTFALRLWFTNQDQLNHSPVHTVAQFKREQRERETDRMWDRNADRQMYHPPKKRERHWRVCVEGQKCIKEKLKTLSVNGKRRMKKWE